MLVTTMQFLGTTGPAPTCLHTLTSTSIQSSQRQALVMLFCIQIFTFASTFAHMIIVALPDSQTAGAVATLMFSMTMIFNG